MYHVNNVIEIVFIKITNNGFSIRLMTFIHLYYVYSNDCVHQEKPVQNNVLKIGILKNLYVMVSMLSLCIVDREFET